MLLVTHVLLQLWRFGMFYLRNVHESLKCKNVIWSPAVYWQWIVALSSQKPGSAPSWQWTEWDVCQYEQPWELRTWQEDEWKAPCNTTKHPLQGEKTWWRLIMCNVLLPHSHTHTPSPTTQNPQRIWISNARYPRKHLITWLRNDWRV